MINLIYYYISNKIIHNYFPIMQANLFFLMEPHFPFYLADKTKKKKLILKKFNKTSYIFYNFFVFFLNCNEI